MSEHPSYLELDRLALGVAQRADTASHVASCDRCRSHVDKAKTAPAPAGWLPELSRRPPLARRRLPWMAVAGALSLAAAVALFWVVRPSGTDGSATPYLASKGAPGVWVFLKRADQVKSWNGKEAILEGDGLRLKVDGGGFSQVSVFSPSSSGGYARLYGGPASPKEAALLPAAWTVDDSPGPEVLLVVLSNKPVEESDLPGLLRRNDTRNFWVKEIVLPKVSAGSKP